MTDLKYLHFKEPKISDLFDNFGNIFGCNNSNDCKFKVNGNESITCESCLRSLHLSNQILIDSQCYKEIENSLEEINYDVLHGVSVESSLHLGRRWTDIINNRMPNDSRLDVLEIGSGTGLLTLGLAMSGNYNLIVSDLSTKFLAINQNKIKSQNSLIHEE
jgi:2-polyprenyl-3-methyl-5-hydroxy-6-metoxy-1,4-benzoquinol methylase